MNRIYFMGYDSEHPESFRYEIPGGLSSWLLVETITPALFRIGGETKPYPAHTAILYPPGHPIWYGACGQRYGNHWIRFLSDEFFVTRFPLQAVPFSVSDPEYCRLLFQLLTWESAQLIGSSRQLQYVGSSFLDRFPDLKLTDDIAGRSDLIISQLLRILFDKLRNDASLGCSTVHDRELLSLRRQIASNPQLAWRVADMADQLHVSAGYLQLLYQQRFHVSCMDDVIGFRLQKARDLLLHTTESVASVAEQCGYGNTEHFCRQFRKKVGQSPGKFRKKASEAGSATEI